MPGTQEESVATCSESEQIPCELNRHSTRRSRLEKEQHRKNEGVQVNGLRRSNRNHHSIRLKGAAPFYRRIQALFFDAASRNAFKSIGGNRLQLKRVSISPQIYVIENFLSEADLEYFDKFIEKCPFQKSFVDNMEYGTSNANEEDGDSKNAENDGKKKSKRQRRTILDTLHRTSTFFGFKHRADSNIRAIEQRTADLLGCWVHQLEGLQLVRYLPGQFFGVHHDMGDLLETDEVLLPPKNLAVKRRLVTLFVYLNDMAPLQGGRTLFPKCNLQIKPRRGRAVLWSNITQNGAPDPRTIHAGEAVDPSCEKGVVKYGLNIWVTEE